MDSKQCEIDLKSVTPLQGFFIRFGRITADDCLIKLYLSLRGMDRVCGTKMTKQSKL